MSNSKSTRVRCWWLVLYLSRNELMRILMDNRDRIANYAFAYHDYDIYDDDVLDGSQNVIHKKGDLKKPHFHLLIDFFHGHTFTAVKKLFTTDDDAPRVEVTNSRKECFEYLIHRNHLDKFQYSYDIIVSPDIVYYEKFCKQGDKRENDNLAEEIINEILKGVSPRLLVARYGRDFVIHMRQYMDCAAEIRSWDLMHPKKSLPELIPVPDEQLEIPF